MKKIQNAFNNRQAIIIKKTLITSGNPKKKQNYNSLLLFWIKTLKKIVFKWNHITKMLILENKSNIDDLHIVWNYWYFFFAARWSEFKLRKRPEFQIRFILSIWKTDVAQSSETTIFTSFGIEVDKAKLSKYPWQNRSTLWQS